MNSTFYFTTPCALRVLLQITLLGYIKCIKCKSILCSHANFIL